MRNLKTALEEYPELLDITGNLAQQCRYALINNAKMSAAAREIVTAGVNRLNQDLGYITAPPLEKLLIEQIILCYLRLYLWENAYHTKAGNQNISLKMWQEWERLIASAQRRYLRSIETLSRVRKMDISIQVNVATHGGQQVNVGNLSTTKVGK